MIGDKAITAAVLVIGDEILSGRTKERNLGIIADHLTGVGIALREARVVADEEAAIIAAVNALRALYTYVFTTGGIGPTHDDITAESIAKALGLRLAIDARAVALMRAYYDARGVELTAARLRMARLPENATVIKNSISGAPGFMAENVIVLAGIPGIMGAMLDEVTPRLATGPKMLSHSLKIDRPEGEVAELFAAHQKEHPDVLMGSYPTLEGERFGTELVLRATDERNLLDAVEKLEAKLSNCK